MGRLYVSISSFGTNPSKPAPEVLQQSRKLIEDMGAQLVKNLPAMRETWVGKIPCRRERLPLQYSGLENAMDCKVHGVTKSRKRLNDFDFSNEWLEE